MRMTSDQFLAMWRDTMAKNRTKERAHELTKTMRGWQKGELIAQLADEILKCERRIGIFEIKVDNLKRMGKA